MITGPSIETRFILTLRDVRVCSLVPVRHVTLSRRARVASEREPGEGLGTAVGFLDEIYPLTPTPLPVGEGLGDSSKSAGARRRKDWM